jgi:hypothetical protein
VFHDGGMQNNNWEIVDTDAMGKIRVKSLSNKGGQGKSTVFLRYKNGVEIIIEYKYPTSQEMFQYKERFLTEYRQFYYARNINYESSHYGFRGVYTLGNNYFVVDHLTEIGMPSSISLATSWNMPKNSVAAGSTGWQRFVFQGTTPSGAIPIQPPPTPPVLYRERSRVEIAVAGADSVEQVYRTFQLNQSLDDTLGVRYLTYENKLSVRQFMVTQFRVCNAIDTLVGVNTQTQDVATITNGLVWTRQYNDNSRDLVVYNPNNLSRTVQGITSNARVWLLHSNNSTSWTIGRLFSATAAPTFTPPLTPTPTVRLVGTSGGVQYDITF